MNEATLHVLDDELRNVPLDSMTHRCWFRTEYGSLRTMFRNSVAPFQRAVLQTGDIPDTTVFYRIQIANDVQKMPTVIGIDGDGKLAVVAYDALDKNQLWRIVEWCGDRFLIHAESKRLLGVPDPDNSPIVGLVGSKYEYSKATLWTWDTSKLARNGFFKLVNNSAQVTVVGSTVQCSESSKFGVRFVQDVPHHFVLTTHHLVLKNFLASHAPVFVHAKEAPLPTNIHRFKQLAENSGKQVSDDPAAPKVYIIVRQATEPIYLNYTDVTFCLLYPPKSKEDMSRGWRFATLRFNNATHDLVSVHLPGRNQGWLHNHKRHNPLRILRQQGPLAPMKLHLYVGRDLVIRAAFPKEVTKESVLDSGKWGSCLDSGNEKVAEIVQAEMLVDDFSGSKPVRPQWVEGTKEWTAGGEGQYMPVAMLDAM